MNRREFLSTTSGIVGGCMVNNAMGNAQEKPKQLAAINSIFYKLSHAYHIEGRIAYGYTIKGKPHTPQLAIRRMFNHQYFPEGNKYQDLSRSFSEKKGFKIVNSISEALGGKNSLDVDGILLIVEHGDYLRNTHKQILYPRFEFFEQIVEVFRASKRVVPIFCDKHLSYDHVKARKMYDTAKELGIPLMAGSSLPVTWRRPEWEPDFGSKIEEAVVCYYADLDIYGIHALESLQCLLERRQGGETGVKSIHTLRNESVWNAWDRGAWSKDLAEAALKRSASRDFGEPRDHVSEPVATIVEYRDGTRATLLHLPGYVADITAAVRIKGDPKPQSTQFMLPAPPGARFFNPLTYYIEQFFQRGESPYPVERTLLTSTMHDFAMRSAAEGGEKFSDPALKVVYQPKNASYFFRGPASDE